MIDVSAIFGVFAIDKTTISIVLAIEYVAKNEKISKFNEIEKNQRHKDWLRRKEWQILIAIVIN